MAEGKLRKLTAAWNINPGQWWIDGAYLHISLPGGSIKFECSWLDGADEAQVLNIILEIPYALARPTDSKPSGETSPDR